MAYSHYWIVRKAGCKDSQDSRALCQETVPSCIGCRWKQPEESCLKYAVRTEYRQGRWNIMSFFGRYNVCRHRIQWWSPEQLTVYLGLLRGSWRWRLQVFSQTMKMPLKVRRRQNSLFSLGDLRGRNFSKHFQNSHVLSTLSLKPNVSPILWCGILIGKFYH